METTLLEKKILVNIAENIFAPRTANELKAMCKKGGFGYKAHKKAPAC